MLDERLQMLRDPGSDFCSSHTFCSNRISPHPSFATLMVYGEQSWSHAFPRVFLRIRTPPFISLQHQIHLIIFHLWIVSHSFWNTTFWFYLLFPLPYKYLRRYLIPGSTYNSLAYGRSSVDIYSGKELGFAKIGFENSSYIS